MSQTKVYMKNLLSILLPVPQVIPEAFLLQKFIMFFDAPLIY